MEKITNDKVEENTSLVTKLDKLKKYLGLVEKNEYGILKTNLTHADVDGGEDISISVSCGFSVIKRGGNKVRIDIDVDDIKVNRGAFGNKSSRLGIKNMLDGWYDINDKKISWIEPDESTKREIKIDDILE